MKSGEIGKQVIQIKFMDGEIREVEETTFSRALVAAAHLRYLEGCDSRRELTPETRAYKSRGWRYYKGDVLVREELCC